jgi:exodeoxyribonuclease VII large subunit
MLTDHAERVAALRDRARRALDTRLVRASGEVGRLEAQVRALSPASTLERGYAVVQRTDGHVVRSPDDVAAGDVVQVRLARGALDAAVTATHDDGPAPDASRDAS